VRMKDKGERFVTDAMLGKLTTYMRMAGYDVLYAPDEDAVGDDGVVELAEREGRTVVTRDVELSESADGLLVKSKDIVGQLHELTDAGLTLELGEPSRCSVCNGTLMEGGGKEAPDDVERSWRCDDCGKVYWKGSHWEDVRDTFEKL